MAQAEVPVTPPLSTPALQGLRAVVFGSALYFASTFLINAAKVLLVPVYARYLSPAQYGVLGIANSISGFVTMFLLLGLDGAVVREYYDYRDDPLVLRSYLSTVMIFLGLVNAAAMTALFLFGPKLLALLLPGGKVAFYPYVALALLISTGTMFLGVCMALLQAQRRVVPYVSAQMVRFVLLVGVTLVLIIRFRRGAEGPLWAEFVAVSSVAVALAWMALRGPGQAALPPVIGAAAALRRTFSVSKLKAALAYGVPLVPHELSNWALAVSDRLILARYRPADEVGVYVLGYSLAMGMNFLVGALNFAYVPFFLETAGSNPRASDLFAVLARFYVLVIGGICLVCMLFSREILGIIAPPSYSQAAGVLNVVLLAFFFLGLYLVAVLPFFHLKKTRLLPLLSGTAAALNIGLNLVLVPRYGAMAAAVTTLVAYAFLFAAVCVQANRFYPIPYTVLGFWSVIATVAAAGLLLNRQPWPAKLLVVIIFGALVTYVNRRDWRVLALLRAGA